MVFNRKGSFFLDLGGDGSKTPASVAPQAPPASPAAAAPAEPALAAASAEPAPALTTAEAIAAELRRDQENRPAPSTVTFAPELLIPSGALPQPRRRAGANLAGFKEIAASLVRG
jgi:hypothetical protein